MPTRKVFVFLCVLLASAARSVSGEPNDAAATFFESKVRPVLAERCFKCHSAQAEKLKAGFHADSLQGLLKGGDNGPAIVPAHPEQSRLIEAIGYGNIDLQMPPKGKLTDQQIADLTQWIKMGAPWPGGSAVAVPDASAPKAADVLQRKIGRWAWQPVRAQVPPTAKDAAWAISPIDHFILAKLDAAGLKPAATAQKRTLIRRACFDLTGLPPAPEEVEVFVADASPDAFTKVIDRLLDSPHFGERWARHWLDLARYAETYGHEFDFPIPDASQYRDYVIRAFNADVPYDQFVTEQVAGDLLPHPRMNPTDGYNESIIGTGFWFLGEQVHSPVDVRQHQADRVDNQIDVFGKTFLGLTIACARCHDHKFDPIKQRDFYSLAGFLESTRQQEALLDRHGKIEAAAAELKAISDKGSAALAAALPQGDGAQDEFTRYLKGAREVISGSHSPAHLSLEDIAREAKLDPAKLGRWVAACREKGVNEPTHPLFAWGQMSDLAPDASPETITAKRQAAQRRWTEQQKRAGETAAATTVFKDFADGNYNGWFVSGWAFGSAPTQAGQWDSSAGQLRALPAGAAHSGALAGRLKGVLRSPTFTLTHPQILYRIAGTGARVHLVIDGYRMDTYQSLLFGGALFDVNTGGKFVWHRQGQDVGRYLGHSAYIEIIDDGNGYAAIDQIRFGDEGSPEPAAMPSAIAGGILSDASANSPDAVAAMYGTAWSQAIAQWRSGKADAGQRELVNWALEHNLIDIDPAAQSKIADCKKQIDAVASAMPEPMRVIAAADGTGIDEHIFIRGNHKTPGDPAPRRFLEAMTCADEFPAASNTSGRLELARRLTDPSDDPLVARVMVNRIWHHLMGRGIVASTDNFGALGQAPTHPELLDYLADRFVKDGWSVKKAIRSIMLSHTYQMASEATDPQAEQSDPDNSLLHRAHVRRLEAESIRDEMLAVSGRLDPRLFGQSVDVNLTAFMEGRGRPPSGPLDGAGRRSIYLAERRNFLSPMMLAFDQPIPFSSMGRRSVSNVPAQALTLMNDPFVLEQAKTWAARVLADKDLTPEQRITRMYLSAYGRSPADGELGDAMAFLQKQGEEMGLPPDRRLGDARVWADLAHAMMNAKEFIFLN
jgi:cytochrome c553